MSTISVVIPTRNRCRLLKRAIESVLRQTYTDWEIIVVDDASTDQTPNVIEQLAAEQNIAGRLKYIRSEKSTGGAIARNIGISSAQGEYVAFLDDDDEWLPEKLQKQIELLQADDQIGICYTGREVVKEGDRIAGFGKRYSFRYPPSDNHFKDIMTDNFVGVTSSVVIPRSILLEIKGFDENLPCFQDYDLFIRILQKWKAAGINEPLVRYYLESSTAHVSFTRKNVETATKYLNEKYKDTPYISLLRRAIKVINLKKMIKSVAYTREVLMYRIKALFNPFSNNVN